MPLGSDRVPFAWFVDQAWFSHSGIVPPSGCNPLAPVGFAGCCLVSVVVVVGTLVATGKESVANFRVLEPPSVQMRSGLEQAHRRLVKGSQREAARKAGSSIFYRHAAASWLAGGLDLRSCSTEEGSHVLAVSSWGFATHAKLIQLSPRGESPQKNRWLALASKGNS